ncbi:MAG: M42 family metallopeptidase [Bacillota bacterium]
MSELLRESMLMELAGAAGVAGNEMDAVDAAAKYFKRYTDRVELDRFGNLIAYKRGESAGSAKRISLALAAHIDEIGAMVTRIEDGGFLRFTNIGGIDPRTLLGQPVLVHGRDRLQGVIGALPPHLLTERARQKELTLDKLYIDVGLSEAQAQEQVRVGDFISLDQPPLLLEGGKYLTGKAMDNRAGVAALILGAVELASMRHEADIYFVATLQEEVGLRGAVTAAYGLVPDLAVAVDVTHGEAPGLSGPEVFELGGGTVIGLGPNFHPVLDTRLRELAAEYRVPYQIEPIPGSSRTDAWAIQVSRQGIPVALLSVPLRYMHSVVELLNLDDLTSTGRLLGLFARGLDSPFVEGLACY